MNYPSGKRKFINGVCFDENKDGSVTVTETYTNFGKLLTSDETLDEAKNFKSYGYAEYNPDYPHK